MKLSHKILLGILALEVVIGAIVIGCNVEETKVETVLDGYKKVIVVNCETETLFPIVDGETYAVDSHTVGSFIVADSVKIGNCIIRAFEDCQNVLTCSDGQVYLEYYN